MQIGSVAKVFQCSTLKHEIVKGKEFKLNWQNYEHLYSSQLPSYKHGLVLQNGCEGIWNGAFVSRDLILSSEDSA